jgi:monovalent cation:H+ antiporter-2, CPA2 family
MPHEFPLLDDLLVLLVASVPIAFLFNRLRLPVIVGFMITGILIGPYGLGFIRDAAAIEALAEIGVVLLLFTIGLEFSMRRIIDLKRLVTWGGGGQVIGTILVTAGVALALGRPANQAIFFGFLIALSSTAIVLKTYMDRAEVDSPHGRAGIGILLFQDLVIVPMMLLIPILSGGEGVSAGRIVVTLATAALAVALIVLAARIVVPFLLNHIVRLRSPEVFVIFVVLVSLGTSWLTARFGLSLALGAFIAGLVLSESEYSHQIVADILPFRDVFNSIFFISIGMLLSVSALVSNAGPVAALVVGLVLGKALVVVLVVRALSYSLRVATITGVGLAQIGEFSFILAKQGLGQGLLSDADYQTFLGASILSMIATPFLIAAAPRLGFAVQSLLSPDSLLEPSMMGFSSDKDDVQGHVIIIGYGINGRNVARVLRSTKIPYRVVELNAEAVRTARAEGEAIAYGDSTRKEVLHAAGIEKARVLVVAIADPTASRHIVHLARQTNEALHIVVRTRYMSEVDDLYKLGADQVIPEEFETSLEIFGRVLEHYGIARIKVRRQKDVFRREGYQMLRSPAMGATELGSLTDVLRASVTEILQIEAGSPGADRSIGELNIRKRTGATVIAVNRGGDTEVNPNPDFRLRTGDSIVLLGSPEQIDASVEILAGPEESAGGEKSAQEASA